MNSQPSGFDLSPSEKPQLVEDLWDDLAGTPDASQVGPVYSMFHSCSAVFLRSWDTDEAQSGPHRRPISATARPAVLREPRPTTIPSFNCATAQSAAVLLEIVD